MIRPKPKPSTAPVKAGAILLTGLILVGAQTGLQGVALPAFASGRDLIRELDPLMFERFAAPPPPPAADETREELPEPAVEEASMSFDQEVGQAMQQLEELFGSDEAAPTVVDRSEQGGSAAPGIAAQATDDRFESLFGGDQGGVAIGRAGRGRTAARDGAGGLGIGINETVVTDSAREARSTPAAGPDVAVSTGAARTASEEPDVAIEEFSSESFDGSEADRLALWMRSNPGDLPVGVRVHVNYEPTFLTSTTTFRDEGRTWELFMMFNESLRELHLVLVEGAQSVYLIDRGFQEESRSLREGTVRRTGGSIVAVDSRSGTPSGERARDFYNVFLSWWEATKADARTP